MRRSDRNRSTSSSRSRRHSSSSRAGGCSTLAPGIRRTWDNPTRTPRRNSFRCSAVAPSGNGGQALLAGQVRGVDQGAQGAGDLAGPDGPQVGLGGVLKVPEQVSVMPISA